MRDAEFPYDVQWTDIDAMMSNLDFTYDPTRFNGLPDLVRSLQSEGKHYINIIDPGVSSTQPPGTYPPYDDGMRRAIFLTKFNSTSPIVGQVVFYTFQYDSISVSKRVFQVSPGEKSR